VYHCPTTRGTASDAFFQRFHFPECHQSELQTKEKNDFSSPNETDRRIRRAV